MKGITDLMLVGVFLVYWIKTTHSTGCNGACNCDGFYFVQNRNTVSGHALLGFSYHNVTAPNPKGCFEHCSDDCRCISFTFRKETAAFNCLLNEENKRTKPHALIETSGFDYYDLVIDYSVKVGKSLPDECSNGCCSTNPCLNGGQCEQRCDVQGKRFICRCPLKFTGSVCQTPRARDCSEVWAQGWRHSGDYSLLNQNENNFTVYCDLTSEADFVWSLVESFSLENVQQFRTAPFFMNVSIAANKNDPEWPSYKMSHDHVLHLRTRSSHWRATCNHPTSITDHRDYARTTFDNFDLLEMPAGGGFQCRLFELINIRGISCTDCTAGAMYGGNNKYTFHIDSQKSAGLGCQFDGSNGALNSEDNFGFYGVYNTQFSCTASSSSTTQIWFGSRK